jgi:hypothetical protein
MSTPPRRGPRVMHGMAAMLRQARDIKLARAGDLRPAADSMAEALQAQRDTLALLQLAEAAEGKLQRIAKVCAKYREQCAAQPEDNPFRQLVESVVARIEQELK